MISLRWRKVARDAWLHKGRTSLVILAIAIGIAGAGSVLNTWALLRRVTHEGFDASNPASATLRVDSVTPSMLATVRALPGISDVAAQRTYMARALVNGSWKTAVLYARNNYSGKIGIIKRISGTWPPADNSVIIENSSVDFSGASLGGTIVIKGTGNEIEFPVSGIAQDVALAPGWMEHVVYAFVTPATIERLGGPRTLNQLQILASDRSLDRAELQVLATRVTKAIEATGSRVIDADVPEPGKHIHAGQIDSLLLTQGLFGLLALFLSAFLVFNLITAMLAGQIREIGIMKSLGADTRQLATMYFGLAALVGLIASALAIPTAALLGRAYAEFVSTLLNFDTSGYAIPRWSPLAQLAVGILLPVGAAAIPVVRGCRVSVSEALRDFGIGADGNELMLKRMSGLGRPVVLALRNALRKRQRTILTLATLAIGGAVYIGALNLRAGIRAAVENLYTEVNRYDQVVRFAEPHSPDSITALIKLVEGVTGAETWSARRAAIVKGDAPPASGFSLIAMDPGTRMVSYPVVDGRWLSASDTNAIVVGRGMVASDSALRVGRTVPLVIDGQARGWEIVGIVDAGPQPIAATTKQAMLLVTGTPTTDLAVLSTSADDIDGQALVSRRLRMKADEAGMTISSIQLMQEGRSAMEDHMLLVSGFLLAMSQLMIVVGGLGLASTMTLAVLERTREIGVMKAIGARHSSILGILQAEALAMSLAAWVVAIPLSIPASVLIGRAFGRVMLTVPVSYVPEWKAVVQWLAVAVIVSLLACAGPALRAMRITTARALAYE